MRILYYPAVTGSNSYTSRFRVILGMYGSVTPILLKWNIKFLATSFLERYDYTFVNWIESDLLDNSGDVRLKKLIKVLMKLFIFKLFSKKVIYVKHNRYPHSTKSSSISLAKKYIHVIESLCDDVIVHSPTNVSSTTCYIPHPLYIFPLPKLIVPDSASKDTFIVFGRITKYKKLDELIKKFPPGKKLIIAGVCDDDLYLSYLNSIVPKNISILSGYLSDTEAENIINNTQGLIISHADADMIVSGSFFYALSIGMRVICVKTEFLEWATGELGNEVVLCYTDVESLCSNLISIPVRKAFTDEIRNGIENNFGDEIIYKQLSQVIKGIS